MIATWSRNLSRISPLRPLMPKPCLTESNDFIDYKEIKVKGGNGGNGGLYYQTLSCNPHGGPSGGDGGNGGHVIIEASDKFTSLNHINKSYSGEDGINGGLNNCYGSSAKHLILPVPKGTAIWHEGTLLRELSYVGDYFIAAHGGEGGRGNRSFRSSITKTPNVAELGGIGQELTFYLRLKLMVDVALIGFPNAGKSTFLRAISRARPRVSCFPFTTLKPHIGVVEYDDYSQITVADLPGIEHRVEFDVERCKCLLYFLDLTDDLYDQFNELRMILGKQGLSELPHFIICNKVDLGYSQLEDFESKIDVPIAPISAKYGIGIADFLTLLRLNI